MRSGQIHFANLGPPIGAEPVHAPPVVIVRNGGANMSTAMIGCGIVTVVPLTTYTDRIHPFHVFLAAADTGLRHDSKAQAEQVRSIAVERIVALRK